MNEVELRHNERLDSYVVQNLNTNPRLPFGNGEFDGAGICVSIDYLTRPVEVLRETGRVLKAGAPLVVTFSNRCFPTKAVEIWHRLDDSGHMQLVEHYFREAGNWRAIRSLDRSPRRPFSDPLYAVVGESSGPNAGELTSARRGRKQGKAVRYSSLTRAGSSCGETTYPYAGGEQLAHPPALSKWRGNLYFV